MKKIKEVWRNNKVLFVLFIILIICFAAIVTVALSYFVGTEKSPYGNRLDNKVELPKNFEKDIETSLDADETVKKSEVRISIRTIYITIEFEDGITLEAAKEKAVACLELITEEQLEYYDINYILKQNKTEESEGFTIMGARNSFGTGIVWNNNKPIVEEEEE
jgi:hypothetical protein